MCRTQAFTTIGSRFEGDLHLDVAPGYAAATGATIRSACWRTGGPLGGAGQDEQGDPPRTQSLLKANPPVRRDQQLEAGLLGGCQ